MRANFFVNALAIVAFLCFQPTAFADAVADADFATRCGSPGVLRCIGFDAPADIAGNWGNSSGLVRNGRPEATLDTNVKASGASSMKFLLNPNLSGGQVTDFFARITADNSVQFGANSQFFYQWRQRFSPEYVNATFGTGRPKQSIVGTGDLAGCTSSNANTSVCSTSCTPLEVVTQPSANRPFPQRYNSCTSSTSHGAFNPFEESTAVGIKLQNAREGQPAELVIDWGTPSRPYNLTAGPSTENQQFGKVWLVTYHGGLTSATAITWFDELIISRNRIPDPGAAPNPPPAAPTNLRVQ